MLLANFTTVRPEMGGKFCPFKTLLIAGTPSNSYNTRLLGNQQPIRNIGRFND